MGNNLPYFSQMLFSLFDVRFCHDVTSMFKFTTFQKRCQGYLAGNENDSDFAVRPDETELKCYSDFINGTTKKRMGQKQTHRLTDEKFTEILHFLYTFVIRVLYTIRGKRFLKRNTVLWR